MTFKFSSISRKILTSIFIVSSLVTLIITIIQISYEYSQEKDELNKNIVLVEKSYSKSIETSLWELNQTQTQTQLEGITSIPGISYVNIKLGGKSIAQHGTLTDNVISKSINLNHFNSTGERTYLGTLEIYANLDQIMQKIYNKIFIIFITQLLKTMLVSFFIYICVQKIVTRHLIDISNFLKDIDLNSLEKPLLLQRKINKKSPATSDELDSLVNSINQMRDKILKSYTELNTLNKILEDKVELKTQLVLEQRKKLEYANHMSTLGEMAGGIAHEINNPISIISSATHMLKKSIKNSQCETEKINSYFEKIERTTIRITKIVNGLLTLSRDSTNEDYTSFILADALEDALSLCGEKFRTKGIKIFADLSSSNFQHILYARRVQISQVFLNLLNNSYDAIEFSEEKWIKIESIVTINYIELHFIDSGLGIPEEIQEKILQPFFTTKQIGKGTGLGLSLSMAIIQGHKGKLHINNKNPHTCFVIILPLKTNQEQQT